MTDPIGIPPRNPTRSAEILPSPARSPTPLPVVSLLPGVFQEDPFTQGFCAAMDQVLLPVVTTLDGFPAYLDPGTAPQQMLVRLASWMGLPLAGRWAQESLRQALSAAMHLYEMRGTRQGLEELLRLLTGSGADIQESGGSSWSATPQAPFPGSAEPFLLVRVRWAQLTGIDEEALRALLAMFVPAHVPWTLDLI